MSTVSPPSSISEIVATGDWSSFEWSMGLPAYPPHAMPVIRHAPLIQPISDEMLEWIDFPEEDKNSLVFFNHNVFLLLSCFLRVPGRLDATNPLYVASLFDAAEAPSVSLIFVALSYLSSSWLTRVLRYAFASPTNTCTQSFPNPSSRANSCVIYYGLWRRSQRTFATRNGRETWSPWVLKTSSARCAY